MRYQEHDGKTKYILEVIGKNVIKLREKQGLKKSELAREAGICKATLWKIETSKSVQIENLVKLSFALRVPIEMFFIEKELSFST